MHNMNFSKRGADKRSGIFVGVVVLLLLGMIGILSAQATWNWKSLTRGKVWATLWNSGQMGNVLDPPSILYTLDYPGYTVGASVWDHIPYAPGQGYYIYGESGGEAKAYTIQTREYILESETSPLEDAALIQNFNLTDPAVPAEEIVTGAHTLLLMELDVHMRRMVWSYPKYDDFIIHEYKVTNKGSATMSNLHFSHRTLCEVTLRGLAGAGGPSTSSMQRYGDDKYGWDEEHQLFYVYDDWSYADFWANEELQTYDYGPGPETGDIGDPNDLLDPSMRNHELLSPGYMTSIILDPAGGDVYTNLTHAAGGGTRVWVPDRPEHETPAYKIEDPPSKFLDVMTYQQPRMSWDEAHAIPDFEAGSKWERAIEIVNTSGPHELAPGASVTFVFADILGEMDRHKIVEGGVENVNLLATESKAALLANAEACRELYNNGYQIADHPPMTPTDGNNSLTITDIRDGLQVGWPPIPSDYQDPATGVNDFAGYKVYRATHFTIGPWTQIADIPKEQATIEGGLVVYQDNDLPLGVGNYYTVTSYDTDGNESGQVNANRFPSYPMRAANLDFPKKVYVVPNPFRQHSRLVGVGEELRMEFIGLPAKCTIRIYTIAGELVHEINHDDGSGGESWGSIESVDYQVNKWLQYIAPAVYVYHVESKVSGQEGEFYIGKFAIIR